MFVSEQSAFVSKYIMWERRDAGQDEHRAQGCRTGGAQGTGMQDRRGGITGEMRDRRDAGQEGWALQERGETGGMQDRRNTGHMDAGQEGGPYRRDARQKGCRTGGTQGTGMQDRRGGGPYRRDARQEGCRTGGK